MSLTVTTVTSGPLHEEDVRIAAELIRGLVDDSALAAAVLQSLTSLRSTLETTATTSPAAPAIIEASESHGSQQNLCLRLRQRAADAQRSQLAIARSLERESALRQLLEAAERSNSELRDEVEGTHGKLRDLEAAHASLSAKEVAEHELHRLTAALRERDQQLLEEQELSKHLKQALHAAAAAREQDRHPSAHAVAAEAAAAAALAQSHVADSAQSTLLVADAMRQRREATVAYESLRAELCRADAELCATRADAQTSAAALGAARAQLELERTARARASEDLAAARLQCERLAALSSGAEAEAEQHASNRREWEAERRRLEREAAREREDHREALLAATSARREAVHRLEEREVELASTKAELGAANLAVERTRSEVRAELTAMHEENAAGATAAAADRSALLAELASVQRERREQASLLQELRERCGSAASLEALMPHITKLIGALEQRREEEAGKAFATATAAATAAAAAAMGGDAARSQAEVMRTRRRRRRRRRRTRTRRSRAN